MFSRKPVLAGLAGFACAVLATAVQATPVRNIAGLDSITFFERSGGAGPTPFTFAVNSAQLTTKLADPLSGANSDFGGVPTEFYDVFYSDADGTFNLDGEFLTISGVFGQELPAGGGLNLAEIGLNFAGDPTEFGNFVASFSALGDNGVPGTAGNAIDGNLLSHTTMGNTVGQNERLRVTLGFLSSSGPPAPPTPPQDPPQDVPEPGTLALLGIGLASLRLMRRKRSGG